MIEVSLFPLHGILAPGLRDGHHDRLFHRNPVHAQKFQRVVQHRRIGTGHIDDRQDLAAAALHEGGVHVLLPGEHAVAVAADRVDLPVVCDHVIGLCPLPAWLGIGGKAGMHHRQGALIAFIAQIIIKATQLIDQEHALVDDRP